MKYYEFDGFDGFDDFDDLLLEDVSYILLYYHFSS